MNDVRKALIALTAAKDLRYSILLFIFSSAISAAAFAHLRENQSPDGVPLPGLLDGTHRYSIVQGERCLGTLEVTLTKNRTTFLSLHGTLGRRKRKEPLADLAVKAQFNPLGQMTEASLVLKGEETKVSIETKNTQPIDISMTASNKLKTTTRALMVPGPLVLQRIGSNYTLESPLISTLASEPNYIMSMVQPLLKGFDVRIAPFRSASECPRETLDGFDIDVVLNQFMLLLSKRDL